MILRVSSSVRFFLYSLLLCLTNRYLFSDSIDSSIDNDNDSSRSATSSAATTLIRDSSILPFFIASDTSQTLQVTSNDDLVQCEIYYDTKVKPVPLDTTVFNRKTPVLDSPLQKLDSLSDEKTATGNDKGTVLFDEEVQQLITDLQDKCVNYDADGFIYEICIGGRVRQRGRNSDPSSFDYLVGTYSETDTQKYIRSRKSTEQPIVLYYTKGDKCGEPDPLRRAEISLHCGTGFTVLHGDERSICSYNFAVTHPSLCKRKDIFIDFIPPITKYMRENNVNTNNNVQDTNPLDFVRSLPITIQQQLNQLSGDSEKLLRNALTQAIAANQEKEEHPTSGLSEADVAGTGGKSIGVDDRERHGGHWTGITPGGQKDTVSSWFMEIHPLWPDALITEEKNENGITDEISNAAKKDSSSSVYRTEWTCTALSTDDLRKGIEVTESTATTPSFISLALTVPKSLGVWNEDLDRIGTHANILAATARSSNRQALPVQIQSMEDSNYYKVIVSVTAVEVPLSSSENSDSSNGKEGTKEGATDNSKSIIDINYVSLTLQVTTDI